MLWFNHPKPVGRRKPVAVQLQQRRDKHTTQPLESSPPDLSILHKQTAPAAGHPLEFTVCYSLAEYVSFMWQHAHHLIRRRRVRAPASWYMLLRSTWGAAFNFVLQGRSRHTYQFTIDRHGIVRTGPGGVTLIGWRDVSAMRSYSRGRMLVLKRGTLPIPSRCLSREQMDNLAGCAAWIKG